MEITPAGALQITNLAKMLPEDVKLAFGTITSAALRQELDAEPTIDRLAIIAFSKMGSQSVQASRNSQ
jgi:hypothetical protein